MALALITRNRLFSRARLCRKYRECECSHGVLRHILAEFLRRQDVRFLTLHDFNVAYAMHVVQGKIT